MQSATSMRCARTGLSNRSDGAACIGLNGGHRRWSESHVRHPSPDSQPALWFSAQSRRRVTAIRSGYRSCSTVAHQDGVHGVEVAVCEEITHRGHVVPRRARFEIGQAVGSALTASPISIRHMRTASKTSPSVRAPRCRYVWMVTIEASPSARRSASRRLTASRHPVFSLLRPRSGALRVGRGRTLYLSTRPRVDVSQPAPPARCLPARRRAGRHCCRCDRSRATLPKTWGRP